MLVTHSDIFSHLSHLSQLWQDYSIFVKPKSFKGSFHEPQINPKPLEIAADATLFMETSFKPKNREHLQ